MDFKNGVINIQAGGYNGACSVFENWKNLAKTEILAVENLLVNEL